MLVQYWSVLKTDLNILLQVRIIQHQRCSRAYPPLFLECSQKIVSCLKQILTFKIQHPSFKRI
jgi:hypothetical protein